MRTENNIMTNRFISNNRLGDILVQSGKITMPQLDVAVREHITKGCLLGVAIIELGYATKKDVIEAIAEQLKIPYIEIGEDFELGTEEIRLIPESVARKFCLVPIKLEDHTLTIAMKDPINIEAIDAIRTLTNLKIKKAITTEDKILDVINKYYKEEAHIESNLQDILDLEAEKVVNGTSEDASIDADQLRIIANDAPVVRFVNLLLLQAIRDRASDIHFEPAEKDITVRLRIDGVLQKVTPPPKNLYQAIVTRIKILANMNITERRLPQDGRFKFKIQDRIIDIRASSLPEAFGEKVVLRILDRNSLIMNMGDVGLEQDMLHKFQRILKQPHGIILLTGPTGSGKTTTLYSALNYLKSPEKNIQTVEDPIEYLIEGINQMQVKSQIDLTFAACLRSILRQDPDIMMIGEIRDLDTARIAIRSSLTGHLVLSTLHTNDSPSAFNRLRDIGIEPYLIAATVNLVMSQRLVRVICRKCKEKIDPPPHALKMIKSLYPDGSSWEYYRGKGCHACHNTGYKGRKGIFEFLEVTEPIRELILQGAGETHLKQRAVELGMVSLLEDGLNKVRKGITTIEEVLSICPSPDNT